MIFQSICHRIVFRRLHRDGSSRTGTYVLLDLVLNRIAKGVKEVNIAATLEHLRDQRQGMVRRKVSHSTETKINLITRNSLPFITRLHAAMRCIILT